MLLNKRKKLTVIVLTFLTVWAQGCGKEEETVETPKPVRSFKIVREQEPAKGPEKVEKGEEAKPVAPPVTAKEEVPAPKEPGRKPVSGVVPSKEKPPVQAVPSKEKPLDPVVPSPEKKPAQVAVPVKKPSVEKAPPEKGEAEPPPAKAAAPEKPAAEPVAAPASPVEEVAAEGYDPKGRIDPFAPLFGGKTQGEVPVVSRGQTVREARQAMLTPLEKLEISQLKLVGVVVTPLRKLAMAEDMTGKGYVVKKGTYVGINSGRVVEILKNGVVIEEEVEDYMGKIVVRKRELKLQKPLGEE